MGDQGPMREKISQNQSESRPAFYALKAGSWRSHVNLLHPPYTVWLISHVVFGWALASSTRWDHLGGAVLAFFLAVGIAAHALDELKDRPLKTDIPNSVLIILAVASLAGALAVATVGLFTLSLWLLPFIAVGVFFVLAYNLELANGRFHSGFWFAIAWGSFPVLTGYFANQGSLTSAAWFGAAAMFFLSMAQQSLSRSVRSIRRQATWIHGSITLQDGSVRTISKESFLNVPEQALKALSVMMPLVAGAMVVSKL